MTFRPNRRVLAAAILILWGTGLVVLARRRHDVPYAELLARGALRLEPATYFYVVVQNRDTVGFASSSIDTSASGFTARDVARVRTIIAGDSQSVTASSTARLSRGFALDHFVVTVDADGQPFHLTESPQAGSGVLPPTLAPVALMLTQEPHVGASTTSQVYNPVARRVQPVTMSIAAESLFSVVDSAALDATRRRWVASHTDTIRSWKIVTPSGGLSAWVDSHGRIVAASEAGGASLMRTAYEIATQNPKLQRH